MMVMLGVCDDDDDDDDDVAVTMTTRGVTPRARRIATAMLTPPRAQPPRARGGFVLFFFCFHRQGVMIHANSKRSSTPVICFMRTTFCTVSLYRPFLEPRQVDVTDPIMDSSAYTWTLTGLMHFVKSARC